MAEVQGLSYFDASNKKCIGGTAQAVIDPNTGLPMPLGAGTVTFPNAKSVQSRVATTPPTARAISTEMGKQAFSGATQQPNQYANTAQIARGLDQNAVQNAKPVGQNSQAYEVAARAMQTAKFMSADEETLRATFGKMAEQIKTRRYKFSVTYTMLNAAISGVRIRVPKDARHIFQLRNTEGAGGRIGNPETAVLLGVRVLTAFSDCKAPIGVTISGAKGNTYTASGGRYVLVLDENEHLKYDAPGLTIHQHCGVLDVHRMERYGHLTMKDIKSTVFPVPGLQRSFVSVNSPIMYIVEKNQEKLKIPFSKFEPMDQEFHVLDNSLVDYVLNEIDNKFFKSMPFTNLSNLEIKLERADGRKWNDPAGVESFTSGASGEQTGTYYLTKQNKFYAWLEIDFMLTNIRTPTRGEEEDDSGNPQVAAAAMGINRPPQTTGY